MTFIDETNTVSAESRHHQRCSEASTSKSSNKRPCLIPQSTSDTDTSLPPLGNAQAVLDDIDRDTAGEYTSVYRASPPSTRPLIDAYETFIPDVRASAPLDHFDLLPAHIDSTHLISPSASHDSRIVRGHSFSSPQDVISPVPIRGRGPLQLYGERMPLPFKVPQEAILFQYYMENLAAQVQSIRLVICAARC